VLGHSESAVQDSFTENLLDCEHYTRPEVVEDLSVPAVLMSGNHQAIVRWRRKQSLGRTYLRRSDLLTENSKPLSKDDQILLGEFLKEH
jgi:tRNA (guanine37-N1)-methyltransferase